MDADGDNDLDFVLFNGGALFWLENQDGNGNFAPLQTLGIDSAPRTFNTNVKAFFGADLDNDGDTDLFAGRTFYEQRPIGDANGGGIFDSADLVLICAADEYEDQTEDNSSFSEGDWNADRDFNSKDLVLAFQTGNYVAAAIVQDKLVAAAIDLAFNAKPNRGD